MEVRLWPYVPGDGGVMCMPLKRNIPDGDKDWRLTTCPVCGEECWSSDAHELALELDPGLKVACTMCALRAGLKERSKS